MKRKILLVDDNKIELEMLTLFLKDEYDILTADSGESALAVLGKKYLTISVIVLDIVMPGMDGYEVMERIKKNSLYAPIPIIVVTALDDIEAHEKALEYGANGFISKPFSGSMILHSVRNAVKLRETSAIANMYRRDRLTNLYNRETFFAEVERTVKRNRPGSYIISCFDIENFKVVNDQYGTEVGDNVLRHVANCISLFVNRVGGTVCRYTADKFAMLFPEEYKDSDEIKLFHRDAMTPPCINRPIRIRIGRYLVSDFSLTPNAMLDRAILAEGSIKGRYDTYIADYDDSMRTNMLYEQQIVNEMAGALRDGQFEAWVQPQYNHATGALIGAEALARWRRDGEIVPPCDFIPIFERNGFIYEMDQYIWRQVCINLRRWLDNGRTPLPISVNISRYDLFQEDFLDVIFGLVQEYRLSTDMLRLEVTESAFAESTNTIINVVNKLIKHGFTVEIDDFGSGYSSLNTLKDVPASILKLDMGFIEDSSDSNRGGNILESVVRMAKWLGMSVIAEGVETKEQADYLKSIGCGYIQGYLYAKPMLLDEYAILCKSSDKEPELNKLKTVDTWDNDSFWDPKSMETLIFNSYVGAACIFEYSNGKSEILRCNDKYKEIFTGDFAYDFTRTGVDPLIYLDEDNKAIVSANIQNAIDTKEESTCDVCLSNGKGRTIYLRSSIRLIATTADRYLFYCVLTNMSEMMDAMDKLRAKEEQKRGSKSKS
ncbi:MAG: EAL domain-containing protein [Synergistaceae bacterium]|nr:EAL domain-containing protein [Synergistaceae bacterium]